MLKMPPLIAVLLSFLGPGLGQIYNRDYKKGAALLALSSLLVIGPSVWMIRKISPHLPDPQSGNLTPETVQRIASEVVGENKHVFSYITFIFLGLWAYAITEAYFRARELHDKEFPGENGDENP